MNIFEYINSHDKNNLNMVIMYKDLHDLSSLIVFSLDDIQSLTNSYNIDLKPEQIYSILTAIATKIDPNIKGCAYIQNLDQLFTLWE